MWKEKKSSENLCSLLYNIIITTRPKDLNSLSLYFSLSGALPWQSWSVCFTGDSVSQSEKFIYSFCKWVDDEWTRSRNESENDGDTPHNDDVPWSAPTPDERPRSHQEEANFKRTVEIKMHRMLWSHLESPSN